MKLSREAKAEIAKRVLGGESQAQVAADYGVTQQTIPLNAATLTDFDVSSGTCSEFKSCGKCELSFGSMRSQQENQRTPGRKERSDLPMFSFQPDAAEPEQGSDEPWRKGSAMVNRQQQLLTSSSSPEIFRRLRKLAGLTLYDVAARTGAWRTNLNFFELEQRPLAERHRVKFAQVVNKALADRVRELRKIGALEQEQGEQIAP